MGFFQKLKDWFTGKSSSSKSSGSSSGGNSSRYSNVSASQYGSTAAYRRALIKKQEEERQKREKVQKAFKVKEFSPSVATPANNRKTELQAQLKKDIERKQTLIKKQEEDEKEKQRQKIAEQNKQATAKLAEIAKVSQRTDALSSGKKSLPPDPKEQRRVNSGVSRAVNKMAKKSESYAERALKQTGNAPTPLAPKLNKNDKYNYGLDAIATRKATNRKDKELAKYNADKKEREKMAASLETKIDAKWRDGSKETAQRIKSGDMISDPDVAKYEMAKHPGISSFTRGALSGATLGASELAIKTLPMSDEMREAEEYYQQNKRKGAEFAGEMAGSLATFGLTGGMSKEAVAKAAPKTMQGIENAATRKLLNSRLIRRAAEKEAIERFGIEGATKEVIEEIVKRRAAAAAAEIGKDTAINLTTGAASDIMHSIKDSENVGDFAKQMGVNAGLNVLLGGATSVVPQFRVGRVADDVVENALRQNADDVARRIVEFPNAEQSGIDVINPNIRNTDEAVENAARNVDEARVEPPSLNEVETAPPKLEDVETAPPPLEEVSDNTHFVDVFDANNNRVRRVKVEAETPNEAVDQVLAQASRENSTYSVQYAGKLKNSADDVVGRIKQVDEELGNRVEALQREFAEVNARAEQGDPAAIARREEIQAEVQSIIDDFRAKPERAAPPELEPERVEPPELKAEPEKVEPPRSEESAFPYENERGDETWQRIREANEEKARRQEMTEAAQKEWEENRQTIETPRSGAESQNVVNKEIQQAAEDAGYESEWTSGKDYEGYSIREADEIWGTEKVDGEVRTKRGGYTLATGMGDVKFAGDMKDAIASGDFDRNVRHNKEEYTKAVNRLVNYLDGKGGKDGKESIVDLINRFENFAKSNKPLTSNEMRDQLYDILAAVDLANGNKDKEWASKLFMAATRAGAEQSSVGGLTLYQWHRIAMSSPEHRAKVVKEQIENMFNNSRKFRKKYLGSVKKKLGDKFSAVGDDLPLDKFMEENPEVSGGMKAAYERLEKATSKEEVETAASEFLLEARKVMPVTAFDQLTQWRYVAMLSSPKTHIKNVVGNIYSGTLGQMSVAMSSSMENRLANELNLTTTKNVDLSKGIAADQDLYLKSASGLSNKARTNAKKGVFEGIELRNAKSKLKEAERKLAIAEEGVDTTELKKQVEELTEKVAEAQKNFDSKKIKAEEDLLGAKAQDLYHTKSVEQLIQDATKWEKQTYGAVSGGLEKASNFIGGALETSDAVAVERIYRETAEKILKANDYERFVKLAAGEGKEAAAAKAICDRIEEYAAEHAAYRAALDTYRNYNAVATWLNKTVKNTLYNADANFIKKAAGFGLHAVMPFTKVPTNIMKRSFDYSPAGLIQGKKMLDAAIESGNYAEINKAVERLAEGTIGTGIASLGMAMGMLDPDGMTVTTRLNRKDERDKAKKDRGYMDYSVKLGNRDYTLEWATPTASDFFVGVETGRMLNNIYQKFADGNGLDFDPSKALEASGEILTRLVEPTLQLGMFQGVNSILEDSMEQRYEEANINPLFKAVGTISKNYVSSMTPSVVRSLSKAFAKSDYYISGKNDLDYRKNLLISKIPGVSAQMLDAKTNAWGEIKNERSDPKERALRGAETLLAPWNSSEITWDDTDTKLYDFAEEYKKSHPKAQTLDFLPKVFYDYNNEGLTFGKNDATSKHVELSNNDAAQYNIARGKAGEDAMSAALESVIFNRWYKDEKGKYTIADSKNYTPEMKAKKIAEFKGKGTKDVVAWVMDQQAFKDATPAEQAQIIREVIGNSGKDTSIGAKRTSELAVAKRHDISEEEYNYKNEVSANAQKALDDAIAAGIVTYEEATDFARNAGKTYYRTDQKGEEGGSVQTYFNKTQMIEYLEKKGYSHEKAEALYNSFKNSNAKPYGSSSGRRGYRRRGYRRRGGGGGGSAKVGAVKQSAYKTKQFKPKATLPKAKSSSSKSSKMSVADAMQDIQRVEAKIKPPKNRT